MTHHHPISTAGYILRIELISGVFVGLVWRIRKLGRAFLGKEC